jgi:hypothetical protein
MKKLVLIFFCVCLAMSVRAQENYLVVETDSLNFRSGPSASSLSLTKFKKGEIVERIAQYDQFWVKVKYLGQEGYLSSKFLKPLSESEQYSSWTQVLTNTGERLECSNITPMNDLSINNFLDIENASDGDAVVKLINSNDICIRVAFIQQGGTYRIKNIPQGIYTTKVAFGKRLSKSFKDDGVCYLKFLVNPEYKDYDTDRFDFFLKDGETEYRSDGVYKSTRVPSYSLRLYIERVFGRFQKVGLDNISEQEFNK